MLFFSIISIIFLLMLAFPISLGLGARRFETIPLFIQQSNNRNPRYFSISFQKIFDKAWGTYDGSGFIQMSQKERIVEADKIELLPSTVCNFIVYAEKKDFIPNSGVVFEKEIYVQGNARIEKIPMIRAIACKGALVLGEGTRVIRWADSDGVFIAHNDCNLGISASSATKLIVGVNCNFRRLYAPELYLGKNIPELGKDSSVILPQEDAVIFSEIIRDIEYVDDHIMNENGVLQNTIITKHHIKVLGQCTVQGHITSHKDIILDDYATVHGNLFAEGNVFIGMNARVLGLVFSQESIFVSDGAVIGQIGKTKSVVARGDIVFGQNCVVYGSINTEGSGSISPK